MQTQLALQVPDEFLSVEAPAGGRARAALSWPGRGLVAVELHCVHCPWQEAVCL